MVGGWSAAPLTTLGPHEQNSPRLGTAGSGESENLQQPWGCRAAGLPAFQTQGAVWDSREASGSESLALWSWGSHRHSPQ